MAWSESWECRPNRPHDSDHVRGPCLFGFGGGSAYLHAIDGPSFWWYSFTNFQDGMIWPHCTFRCLSSLAAERNWGVFRKENDDVFPDNG